MAGVTDRLEDICRDFASARGRTHQFPVSELAEEIAVLWERLDGSRELHRRQLQTILREECRLRTDLMALVSYEPRVYRAQGEQRTGLKKRLHTFGVERRKLTNAHGRRAADTQDRMFQVLRQYRTLQGGEA